MRTISLVLVACIAACSSSGSGGTSTSTVCADECNAQHKCVSTVDVDTCTKQCENNTAASGSNIRGDYISALDDCYNTSSCNDLAGCSGKAAASVAATSTTTDFCNKLIAKQKACGTTPSDPTACLNVFKIVTDDALSSAESCFDKACSDYAACVKADFGF